MNWKHRTLIIPIALAEPARAACMALTGSASEGLFTTLLCPEGGTEATHAISSGYIDLEFADLLPYLKHERSPDGTTETLTRREYALAKVQEKFKDTGKSLPDTAFKGMLDNIYCSNEEPYAAMARLGLVIAGGDGVL